jgi:hypothetical protein
MYHRSAAATTQLEKKKAQHTSQRRHLTRNASSATVTCTSCTVASREAFDECSNCTKAFATSIRLNTNTAMPWPSTPDGLQLLQASTESETKATSKLLRHSKSLITSTMMRKLIPNGSQRRKKQRPRQTAVLFNTRKNLIFSTATRRFIFPRSQRS